MTAMPMLTRLFLTIALALASAALPAVGRAATTPALVLDADQQEIVKSINKRLNAIGSIQGDFVQIGPNGERSEGRVYIQRPGKMRFEYDKPHPILIVSDGDRVAVEDRKAQTTDQYPLDLTPLRLILGENINLGQDAEIVAVERNDNSLSVTLAEKSGRVPGQLNLLVDAETMDLVQWTVTDAQGLQTSVALYNMVEGKKAKPSLFYINENIFPEQRGSQNPR
ncbi:MAG: outer membrane lipoprotein carrier protein LolA [Flavobacteriaceae bacterium]